MPFLLLCAAAAASEDSIPSSPAAVFALKPTQAERFLREVERNASSIVSLKGQFRQTRKSPLFIEDVVTTGQFYCKIPKRGPATFWCDMRVEGNGKGRPDIECVNRVVDSTSYLDLPETGQHAEHSWDANEDRIAHLNHLLLGFLAKAEEVTRHYDVELLEPPDAAHSRLRLEPYLKETTDVKFLLLDFDNHTLYPTRVLVHGEEGNEAEILITGVEKNVPIDENRMRPGRGRQGY